MTVNIEKIGDAELMAYVDGQLSTADRETVERYLATDPAKAEEVAEWQRQSAAIGALFNHVAEEPVPSRLDPHKLAGASRPANDNFWRAARAVAAALVLVTTGWYARELATPQPGTQDILIADAFKAHELFAAQKRHPVEVGAEESAHLTSWLSASLDRRLVVPAALPNGFTLVGGRLLPAGDVSAAQLMYETDGRRVTLYLTPRTEADPKQNKFAAADGLDALYWANDAVTCTIVGDLTRAEMEEIASEVFKALNWQDSSYRGV